MIRNAELPGLGQSATRRCRRTRASAVPLEILGIGYFVLLVALGVSLVWQPAKMTQVRATASQLEKTLQDLRLRNEDLKKTVAKMESLAYVESEARGRLGMVAPAEVRTCEVTEKASLAAFDAGDNVVADKVEPAGIRLLIARIAGIFSTKEATANGKR